MAVVLQPSQILVTALAGWITRHQDAVVEFLREENRVLKQQLGGKRRSPGRARIMEVIAKY